MVRLELRDDERGGIVGGPMAAMSNAYLEGELHLYRGDRSVGDALGVAGKSYELCHDGNPETS